MNPKVSTVLAEVREGLRAIYGEDLAGVYLYGSCARGEEGPASDLDVVVILPEVRDPWEEIQRTSEMKGSLSLRHDVSLSFYFVSRSAWDNEESPFLDNVRREAVGP
ncbi:MAG: nucleotidyltransferase domain-containing protein [Nitrospinota bacterium]